MNIQQAEEGLIGISIRENQVRMTEAVEEAGHFKITRVSKGGSRIPFSFSVVEDRSNIPLLAQDINRVYETAGFSSNKASLSLDSDLVLIKKIPVDASLEGDELREHVRWEVSQFMINPLDHFIVDYEELRKNGQQPGEADVVVVVVRKVVIDFIKEIFASTDLHLRAVDVDVFSAQRVLKHSFQFPPDARIALVDLRKNNLQISVLHDSYFLSQEIAYPAEDAMTIDSNWEEHIARVISKELRRIILDNKLGKSIEDLHKVFIYGDNVENRMIEILSRSHNIPFHRINPFEKIPLISAPTEPEVQEHPESFVTSVGAAIRNL